MSAESDVGAAHAPRLTCGGHWFF